MPWLALHLPIAPTPAKIKDITIQRIEEFHKPYAALHSDWILAWFTAIITPIPNKIKLHKIVQIFTNINKIFALFLPLSTMSLGSSATTFGSFFGSGSLELLLLSTLEVGDS